MTLDQLKNVCDKPKRVIVTGMQRSGTHIASLVIADLTGKARVVESEFRITDWNKFLKFAELDNVVIHAPALSHKLVEMANKHDCFIVYMRRPFAEINKSLKKIWSDIDRRVEMKAFEKFKCYNDGKNIIDIKNQAWNREQKTKLKDDQFIELEYKDLAQHRFWNK